MSTPQEVFRSKIKESKESKSQIKKAALVMMAMAGHNIVAPDAVSKPIIDEAVADPEMANAMTNMIITMERLSPSKRKDLLKCIAVKYLEQIDMMDLHLELGDINSECLAYIMEHPECKKSEEECQQDFLEVMRRLTGSVASVL